ncbi:MAG: type II secretion system protein [Candidatus Cloacimonetes bacterium]|nr:type II secretion system protein [Candidatus Cloacimonadota bacterium]
MNIVAKVYILIYNWFFRYKQNHKFLSKLGFELDEVHKKYKAHQHGLLFIQKAPVKPFVFGSKLKGFYRVNSSRQKGLSLIEIMVALVILVGGLIPLWGLFSGNAKYQDLSKKYTLAHFVAHRVLEKVVADSSISALDDIPTHKKFLGFSPDSTYGLSPYFELFESSTKGIDDNFPNLKGELKHFRLNIELLNVKDSNNTKNARVEVQWHNPLQQSKVKSLVLQTVVGNIAVIK